jgi:hypothetical protein
MIYDNNTGTTSEFPIPVALDPGTTYYWRVSARNASDVSQGWSPVHSFRTIMLAPTLVSPVSDGLLSNRTPVFDWDDVIGVTNYTLQIARNNTFKTIVKTVTVVKSTYTPTINLPLATLWWRVRANGSNGPSSWSEKRKLVVTSPGADRDGDGLPDIWEVNGYDADGDGTPEVNLPALGADPNHKDIFVEMDYMPDDCGGTTFTNGLAPNATVISSIVASFAAAPVSNPDGFNGINIHLEMGNEVACDPDLYPVNSEFYALKAANFDPKRAAVYHYMIWAVGYNGGNSSGLSFGIPATDFIVTLGSWGVTQGTDNQKIGTFLHELGHNLNLTHGGVDNNDYKPNYLSIMNYLFQTRGVYRNGTWGNFDYQRISNVALNEAALNETLGLKNPAALRYGTTFFCPGGASMPDSLVNAPIDWNCDGDKTDTSVRVDINHDGAISSLSGQNDWPALVYNGGGIIGSGLAPQTLLSLAENILITEWDELTWDQQQKIDALINPAP